MHRRDGRAAHAVGVRVRDEVIRMRRSASSIAKPHDLRAHALDGRGQICEDLVVGEAQDVNPRKPSTVRVLTLAA